ncbi:MAG: hypothetical protein QM754_03250 [Tepidisphaeraceae bacterium]
MFGLSEKALARRNCGGRMKGRRRLSASRFWGSIENGGRMNQNKNAPGGQAKNSAAGGLREIEGRI